MKSHIELGGAKGIRHVLGTNDTQQNPEEVDLGTVIPVIEMGMQGHLRLNDVDNWLQASATTAINGVQTKTYRILSTGVAGGADPQIVLPIDENFVVWGMKFAITFDAAGAAAVNNKFISFELTVGVGWGAGVELVKYFCTFQGNTGILQYSPGSINTAPLDRNAIQIIPAGCYSYITMWMQDGTNFPANTTCKYRIGGISVPVGASLPLGI